MTIWVHISNGAIVVREFFLPSYRPERHYMRGPGPACARIRRRFDTQAGAH